MDPTAVATAVDELAGFLRADGADLVLVNANPKTDRITLRSYSTTSRARTASSRPTTCATRCSSRCQRRVPGEFELVLDDPRRS